jgi:hypothetical protein
MTDAREDRATVERSQLKDQLMDELYPEFSKRVAAEPMEQLIAAELARSDGSEVRDFLPIFVRRRVRAQLRERAAHAPTASDVPGADLGQTVTQAASNENTAGH